MNLKERPVRFGVEGRWLRGFWHEPDPDGACRGVGVIFLHGWAGCRLGPHRMFVKTARRLAWMGCACLRFDFGGRGESDGSTDEASIQSMIGDARAAVDFLMEEGSVRRLVLLGICSGGKVAIGAAARDARVEGLALWSAEPMGELRHARIEARKSAFALRAYARKLMRWETWRKLVLLRVNTRLVRRALMEHEAPDAAETRAESVLLRLFRAYQGRMIFIYGSRDPETENAALRYRQFCESAGIQSRFHEIPDANHSFYSLDWERQVMDLTSSWLKEFSLQ